MRYIVYIAILLAGTLLFQLLALSLLLMSVGDKFEVAHILSKICELIFIFFLIKKLKWQQFVVVKKISTTRLVIYCLFAVVFATVFKIIKEGAVHFNFSISVWRMMSGLIIAPVLEEIIFRGVSYEYLSKNGIKNWVIILVSTVVFGLGHLPFNSFYDIQFFIVGLALMFLYIKERNLLYCIVAHFVINVILLFF